MSSIVPHLWFDKGATEAAQFYVGVFPRSSILHQSILEDTPSGDVEVLRVSLSGFELHLLGAGPEFRVNPSLSFLVNAASADEVNALHAALIPGGSELMPLDTYPFSARYAWVQDKFGVSWQLMVATTPIVQKIVPAQMFVGPNAGKAAEAMAFYTGLFGGKTVLESNYGPGAEPNAAAMINHAQFTLGDRTFAIMDSAYEHDFQFNEAHSYLVNCQDQAEIDRLWAALSSDPSAEACGWCKDRYGFSWQIVPHQLDAWMSDPAKAGPVSQAFLKMKKLDVASLERAARGESTQPFSTGTRERR